MKYVTFDKTTGVLRGFYSDEITAVSIPSDAINITEEEWLDLVEWQGFRKIDPITRKILKQAIPLTSPKPLKKNITQQLSDILPGQIIVKTVDADGDSTLEGRTLEQLTSFPQLVYRFADSLDVSSGGILTNILDARQRYSTYSKIIPATLGDTFGFSAAIADGPYELALLGVKEPDSGIIRILVNGVDQNIELNWQNTKALIKDFNVETKVNITIPRKGVNFIDFKVVGKGETSTGHSISLTRITMKRL